MGVGTGGKLLSSLQSACEPVPKTMNEFKAIRSSLDSGKSGDGDSAPPLGQDDLLQILNELTR